MRGGIALKVRRITLGIKQKDLANKLGISPQYLSQLENGVAQNPSVYILRGLTEELGIPIETLIFTELEKKGGEEDGKRER